MALVAGANAKAAQTSGLEAARALTLANTGVTGVNNLAQSTASPSAPSTQIRGGMQFNTGLGTGDVSLLAMVGGAQTPAGVVISLQ